MKILLIGRTGQVGSALDRALAPMGELIAFDRKGLDLRSVGNEIAGATPDIIVNAAAYTAVDRAEQEKELAFAVNSQGVKALAREAKASGALLIHFSTDYVFDGEKKAPYTESDATGPLNVYGASKLEGDRAIAASGCRHFIFRTSWVYGPSGRNFVQAILAAAKTRPELRVVNDQHGAPTSSVAIAEAIAGILSGLDVLKKPSGIYHLSAAGQTTWYDFAREILAQKGLRTPVVPVPSEEYITAARRPKNSLLDNRKLRATFGAALADWRQGFRDASSKINAL